MLKFSYNKALKVLNVLILLVLTACLVSFVMLMINGAKPVLSKAFSDESEEGLSSRLDKTPDYGQAYINSIIFVGDSTVANISSTELLSETFGPFQVWSGLDGELALDYNLSTSNIIFPETQKEISIPSAAEKKKPDYIVITVGVENGVPYCSEEKFKEYYTMLIESVRDSSPSTKIILQSILPVSKAAEKKDPSISNERIDNANRYIASLAEELSVRYLNTASALKGEDGRLDPRFDSGDGITLNGDGFAAMLDYIRTHGYK